MAGTPALVIDERGITTPHFGLVLWSEIGGLVVRVSKVKGIKIYWLLLSVREPKKYFARLNPVSRWLTRLDVSSARDRIPIPLNLLSHESPYIEAAHVRATYGVPKTFGMRR